MTSFALEQTESSLIPGGIKGNARGCGAASGDIPWGLGRDTSAAPRHWGRAATPEPCAATNRPVLACPGLAWPGLSPPPVTTVTVTST